MKSIMLILASAALVAGCNISTLRTGTVRNSAEPAPIENTDEHLGDPTFSDEVVDADERASARRAVVGTEGGAEAPADTRSNYELGFELLEQGKKRQARAKLTHALDDGLTTIEEQKVLEALDAINIEIFTSAAEEGDMKWYTIEPGDTLGKIAGKFGTNHEMLSRINGLKDHRIRAGAKLKVPKAAFSVVVRKQRFIMDLKLGGNFISRYVVGLGVDDSTPLGTFTVSNRIPKPADGSWPYGHPKHRLGTRWIGLHSEAGHKGYGIHGCRPEEYSKLGGECSQGCVRMTNDEVEELYDILPVGTTVTIIER